MNGAADGIARIFELHIERDPGRLSKLVEYQARDGCHEDETNPHIYFLSKVLSHRRLLRTGTFILGRNVAPLSRLEKITSFGASSMLGVHV